MRMKLSQIKPGHVLLEDVPGKSGKPIIRKNTILTDHHIGVLHTFQVKAVSVGHKQTNRETPTIEEKTPNRPKQQERGTPVVQETSVAQLPFDIHYQEVVAGYMIHFKKWQNKQTIDLPALRKLFLPLIDRLDDVNQAIYTLHHLAVKDTYLYHHAVAVGVLSSYLGRKIGYSRGECLQLGLAGLLADCGMSRIDPVILDKDGVLTTSEFETVKEHVKQSYYMVEQLPTLSKGMKLAVLEHHERQDGSGYPLGLVGGKIHMFARIVAVCDMYHAMTCERIYREKTSPFKVIELLEREQFKNLDPVVIQTFIKSLYNVTVGTKVILSNNRVGSIVFIDNHYPTRPMVRMEDDDSFIALKDKPELHISDILG